MQAARETKLSPSTTIWKGHIQKSPIDNDSYFRDLINKYGNKAELAIQGGNMKMKNFDLELRIETLEEILEEKLEDMEERMKKKLERMEKKMKKKE